MTNQSIRLHGWRRRGMSVAEMAFALLIIGAVLAGVWMAVGHIYRNWDTTQTEKQLGILTQVARQAHLTGAPIDGTTLIQLGLPADMLGTYKGETIIYDHWRGRVNIYSGDALHWQTQESNGLFTVRLESIPNEACVSLITHASALQSWGLVALYLDMGDNRGKLICFNKDSYCKDFMADLSESQAKYDCAVPRAALAYTFTN